MSYVHNRCVFYEVAIHLAVGYVPCYCRGCQEPHFLLCYNKEPHHTHDGHTWT